MGDRYHPFVTRMYSHVIRMVLVCTRMSLYVRMTFIYHSHVLVCHMSLVPDFTMNQSISDCNWTRTQNLLVRKRTLNHLAKGVSVRLRTKWFWVRVQLRSLKLKLRFRACFEKGIPWHLGNYSVWIHSETCTWHDKNKQSLILWFT